MNFQELEVYDPLEDKPTLILYLAKENEKWVKISSDDPVVGTQLSAVLNTTWASSLPVEKRSARVGERLTYTQYFSDNSRTYKTVPSEWVVVKLVQYEPSDLMQMPDLHDIVVAYCERQPLSQEEIERFNGYEPQQVCVSLDSFDGDRETFERFCKST